MTNVTERCAALRDRIARLEDLHSLQAEAAKLGQRQKELQQSHALLQDAMNRARVLANHGHLGPLCWPEVARLLPLHAQVTKKFSSQPQKLVSGKEYSRLMTGLDIASSSLRAAVNESWKNVVRDCAPVDESFLAAVAEVPGQRTAVDRIRDLRRTLSARGADAPSTEEAYVAFRKAADALAKAVVDLDPQDFPPDVLEFFKAAGSPRGAPLNLMTAGVRDWLSERSMLGNVRVRYVGDF